MHKKKCHIMSNKDSMKKKNPHIKQHLYNTFIEWNSVAKIFIFLESMNVKFTSKDKINSDKSKTNYDYK